MSYSPDELLPLEIWVQVFRGGLTHRDLHSLMKAHPFFRAAIRDYILTFRGTLQCNLRSRGFCLENFSDLRVVAAPVLRPLGNFQYAWNWALWPVNHSAESPHPRRGSIEAAYRHMPREYRKPTLALPANVDAILPAGLPRSYHNPQLAQVTNVRVIFTFLLPPEMFLERTQIDLGIREMHALRRISREIARLREEYGEEHVLLSETARGSLQWTRVAYDSLGEALSPSQALSVIRRFSDRIKQDYARDFIMGYEAHFEVILPAFPTRPLGVICKQTAKSERNARFCMIRQITEAARWEPARGLAFTRECYDAIRARLRELMNLLQSEARLRGFLAALGLRTLNMPSGYINIQHALQSQHSTLHQLFHNHAARVISKWVAKYQAQGMRPPVNTRALVDDYLPLLLMAQFEIRFQCGIRGLLLDLLDDTNPRPEHEIFAKYSVFCINALSMLSGSLDPQAYMNSPAALH